MDDLRSALEAATNTVEAASQTPPVTVENSAPAASVASPAGPASAPQTDPAAGVPARESPAATPSATDPAAVAPEGEKDTSPKEGETDPKHNLGTVIALKPPGTWTPQARERWAEIHVDVQQDIVKREREMSRAMTQSSDARQFKKQFDTAVAPFMGFIAAENSNPIQAAVNMMQTAAALRTGTQGEKAQLVATIIQRFGVDLMTLDGLLAGQAPSGPGAVEDLINKKVQERISPYLQKFQQREQQETQAMDAEVETELTTFKADPANEFYEDVKDLMGTLLETDMRRGGNMGLTEAYRAAILLSEPVRVTLEGRKTNQSAQRGHQIAQQARSGAISVKPSDEAGVTSVPPPGDSIRDSIVWAMDKTSGR